MAGTDFETPGYERSRAFVEKRKPRWAPYTG
jgi:hypothetical protein